VNNKKKITTIVLGVGIPIDGKLFLGNFNDKTNVWKLILHKA
jgi:hypothetical protein